MKKRGAIPEKTVLVVSPKGNSFILKDPKEHGMGAENIQNAINSLGGQPKFNKICTLVATPSNWTRVWDDERMVPYMYKGEEWVSYEDKGMGRRKKGALHVQG